MDIETLILAEIRRIAKESEAACPADLGPQTEVFESGLDSLGFAILVASLEDRLGFDPFLALTEAVYPHTVGEFIAIYAGHAATA